jgi:uroporphyrinogen decarboxylase
MTPRERFLETLGFGSPDRIPFSPGEPRESTLRAWHAQGLPEGREYMDPIREQINVCRVQKGLAPAQFQSRQPEIGMDVSFKMIPTFEEQVLEHKDGHYILQDWMGAITEISDEFDYTYIRAPRDFVTRKWHRFPVQSRKDWEERMKWRFSPKDPRRFPPDFEERCARLRDRDYPLIIGFNGPFWQLREFVGFEGLCALLLEQPDFVREMANYWKDFCSEVLQAILNRVVPDMLIFSEDMAFKEHPMISPEMTREFCGPCYRQWTEQGRAAGLELFSIDSDGRIDALIPVWMDCGVNCVEPIEVAAGNDVVAMRAAFGKRLAFRGSVDKRAMAAGGATLDAELERVRPVVESGGFIPSCDHGVPSDVSWPNYQDYAMKLAGMTGWLTQ